MYRKLGIVWLVFFFFLFWEHVLLLGGEIGGGNMECLAITAIYALPPQNMAMMLVCEPVVFILYILVRRWKKYRNGTSQKMMFLTMASACVWTSGWMYVSIRPRYTPFPACTAIHESRSHQHISIRDCISRAHAGPTLLGRRPLHLTACGDRSPSLPLPRRIPCATPDLLLKHPNATLATFLWTDRTLETCFWDTSKNT
jgi:hypothetical protein